MIEGKISEEECRARAERERRVRNKEKHGDIMEMIKMRGRRKKTNNKARKTAKSERKHSEQWR